MSQFDAFEDLELDEAVSTVVEVAIKRGVDEGRRLERAVIAADLRACAAAVHKVSAVQPVLVSDYVEGLADRYERGEHEEGK